MINIKNLSKKYGDNVVYDNFNLSFDEGKITGILGESGSGKTTLVNILSDLTDYEGKITGIDKPLSVVFQSDRLVKNLTAKENILLVNKNADITDLFNKFGLSGRENDYIKSLSGGMARRIAIMRGLAFDSNVLLLDEPFINLDLALKFRIMDILLNRQQTKKQTVIFVTHDIKEAVNLSDRIIVLKKGNVVYDNREVGLKDSMEKEKVEKELFNLMMNIDK